MISRMFLQGFLLLLYLVYVSTEETTVSITDANSIQTEVTTNHNAITASASASSSSSMASATSATFTFSTSASTEVTMNTNSTNRSMISCKSFTCNTSACYDVYMKSNSSLCTPGSLFCELKRLSDMSYMAGCSAGCPANFSNCWNSSQGNCTVDCCGSSDCLNSTLLSISATTVAPTTSMTTMTTTPTTTTTAANNGKKCHKLTCTGEKCYQADNMRGVVMLCPNGQDYCQLKKTVSGVVMTWEAGCGVNCMTKPVCTSTAVDCHQECCNATTTASCLRLNGTLNMPNAAAALAGPHTFFVLVACSLVVWILGTQSLNV